jgi:hypothetical protein
MIITDGAIVLDINKSSFVGREMQLLTKIVKVGDETQKEYSLIMGLQYNTQVDKMVIAANRPEIYVSRNMGKTTTIEISASKYNELLIMIEDHMELSIDEISGGQMLYLEEEHVEESEEA